MSGASGQLPLPWQRLDVLLPLKLAMSTALRECGLSREQVVDRVNELAAVSGISLRVTINTLEKWVAPSAAHRIPVDLVPVFCQATESLAPLKALAAPLGAAVVGQREQHLIVLAEAELKAKELARRKRRAIEALEDLERGR